MTEPRLTMSGVRKSFGATIALGGVELSINGGEVHALVGENGAGKSTLMKILAGAINSDAGEMTLDGESYSPRNPLHARHSGVAMIYQELALCSHLSVEENILLGIEPSKFGFLNWKEVRTRATAALAELEHPDIQPGIQVGRLSIAAQQLVEIARAVVIGCRVLVLDEPTSSLTQQDVRRLFKLINRLKDQGLAIVYISHFLEEVQEIADRYTVLRDGETVGTGEIEGTPVEDIIAKMVGRNLDELYPRTERTRGEPILEIRDVAGPEKPEFATLTLHRGEIFGIAGLVGAGRTELLRVLFGLDPVKSGDITIGAYTGPASPARRWNQGVGLLSEDRKNEGLALSRDIADNTTLSRLDPFGSGGFINPKKQAEATDHWIKEFAIRCQGPRQPVGDLSGGNQQKVALARLLHHDVDVLLLDEPTRGIDVGSKRLIYEKIDALAAGRGTDKPRAILMVSSYLPELLGTCDRIAVMCRGELGEAHPVGEVDEHTLMVEATGLERAD